MTLSYDQHIDSNGASARVLEGALSDALEEVVSSGAPALLSLPAPMAPSEALLAGESSDAVAWAEPGGLELSALGSAAVIEGHGRGRFGEVASAGKALLGCLRTRGLTGAEPAPARLFGGFSFQPGTPRTPGWRAFGEARFVLPEIAYLVEGGRARLVVAALPERLQQRSARDELVGRSVRALGALERGFESTAEPLRKHPLGERPDSDWIALAEEIRREIATGALEKVVLARRVEVDLGRAPEAADVLFRLRRDAPECTRFLFRQAGVTFLGATPEWLAKKRGNRLETEAVAGSIGALEDGAPKALLESQKDLAEHAIVLGEIVKVLGPVATRIEHPESPDLISLRHVLHLRTRVTAELTGRYHLLDLVERLHPTPAVGGLPTPRALEWIGAHEPDERGWYAAPVGFFDGHGDGNMAVALRSGLLSGKTAELFVGSGIVLGSAPVAELTETRWKLRALLGALGVAG
jgi:menaquinone-specific isochorismate synthase